MNLNLESASNLFSAALEADGRERRSRSPSADQCSRPSVAFCCAEWQFLINSNLLGHSRSRSVHGMVLLPLMVLMVSADHFTSRSLTPSKF